MTTGAAISVLIVEDEALVAAEIEHILLEAGMLPLGVETSAQGAREAIARHSPALVLLDVHLADGPTGVEIGREAAAEGAIVIFMTANRRRLPPDFAGAVGAVAKPYTEWGLRAALRFVTECLETGSASRPAPSSLELAPAWGERWRAGDTGSRSLSG